MYFGDASCYGVTETETSQMQEPDVPTKWSKYADLALKYAAAVVLI